MRIALGAELVAEQKPAAEDDDAAAPACRAGKARVGSKSSPRSCLGAGDYADNHDSKRIQPPAIESSAEVQSIYKPWGHLPPHEQSMHYCTTRRNLRHTPAKSSLGRCLMRLVYSWWRSVKSALW